MAGPLTNEIGLALDWFELLLLVTGKSRLGRSKIRDVLAAQAPELSEDSVEDMLNDLFAEVDRRADLAGDLYPFSASTTALLKRDVSADVEVLYIFLALGSLHAPFRKARVGFSSGRLFEHIVARALEVWGGGTAYVFADVPAGERAGIRSAIESLGRRLAVESYPKKARKARKDHGLDVVAYRSFRDRRTAYPVVLCQCTLAWSLVKKARDVATGEWGTMLDVREGTFTAALAVPHALAPDYEHWDEVRRNTDLLLERLRLLELLGDASDPTDDVRGSAGHVLEGLREWHDAESAAA